MDSCKIAPGIYQYTAIDDCSRYRVLNVYSPRSTVNTLLFLDQAIEKMPFPIQRAHGPFKWKTPMELVCEHLEKAPLWGQVHEEYELKNERVQLANYQQDLKMRQLR